MNRNYLLLFFIACLLSGCLTFFADPSENPPRTFMKSLAKKDGNWSLTSISLKAFTEDPVNQGVLPAIDQIFSNTGIFHFDNYDGDIDGTGSFTPGGLSAIDFTFKVPDFDETTKQQPDLSIFFNGYPVMICTANNYKESDIYTFTGTVYEPVNYFPLVAGLPDQTYRKFEFTFICERQ